jgi:hypothetical protein
VPGEYGGRFLLAKQLMGEHVDFYCKSGKDRTGRMQNFLEDMCEFKRQFGRFPQYDVLTQALNKEDAENQIKIRKVVAEFSVGRDIANQNIHGARGLQLHDSIKKRILGINAYLLNEFNFGLPNRSGNLLGKMATSIFNASKLKSWLKKLFGLGHLNTELFTAPRANRLIGEQDYHGFKERVVKLADYLSHESDPDDIERSEIQTQVKPVFRGVKLVEGEGIVAEKVCTALDAYSTPVIARIVHDANGSVSDMTHLEKEQVLLIQDDVEFAKQQAFMALRPPFNPQSGPLYLSGHDLKQVARVHAALLYFKEAIPGLSHLQIEVSVNSQKPGPNPREFINQQLNGIYAQKEPQVHVQKNDLAALYKKQAKMKTELKQGRETIDLNLVPGQRLR